MSKYNQRKHRQKSKSHVKLGKYRNKFTNNKNSKTRNKKYGGLTKQEICKSFLLTFFTTTKT